MSYATKSGKNCHKTSRIAKVGLAASFNPATVNNLMCRTLVSVSWDGYLFDCDFNLAAGLHLGMGQRHISTLSGLPPSGTPIAISDHCYACTAGSGFT